MYLLANCLYLEFCRNLGKVSDYWSVGWESEWTSFVSSSVTLPLASLHGQVDLTMVRMICNTDGCVCVQYRADRRTTPAPTLHGYRSDSVQSDNCVATTDNQLRSGVSPRQLSPSQPARPPTFPS